MIVSAGLWEVDGPALFVKAFVFADGVKAIQPSRRCFRVMSKAQEVFEAVNAIVEKGETKANAFRQLAEQYGQPVDSVRGSYYGYSRKQAGGTSRPRRTKRRETTPADAVEVAVDALTRSIESIDHEIEAAKERAEEAAAEYESMKASADERKETIQKKIDTLKSDA
ncbi:MAG: hypothetical protein IPK93_12385 [Solirubrobacterales bacterium]|nr:hypothetical protein [Solirubrobacterales bacterium]